MERVQVVNHQTSDILYLDFSGLKTDEEIVKVINESIPLIRKNLSKPINILTNIHEMHFNNDIVEIFEKFTEENKDYVKASAIVGASGLQEVMISSVSKRIGRKFRLFPDIESAKNWLIDPPLLVYFIRISNEKEHIQI